MAQSVSGVAVAVGAAPLLFLTVKVWELVRPWMKASASIEPLLSESYWITSPTPMLLGSPLAKVAVEPEIVSALPAPLARAVAVMPTER